MKKRKYSLLIVIFLLILCLLIYFFFPLPNCPLSSLDKRAVWFSYYDLAKFSYDSKENFHDEFAEAINNVQKYKTNTIIVHVRAFNDALYESRLFPMSKVITGKDSLSFDPLKEMVNIAHDNGISIEAWINPYRISLNKETYEQFIERSPKSQWLKDNKNVIGYATYKYILDPASQDVRDYIVAGVVEIVENYDVDGIHFDDYFYVEGTHEGTTENQRMDNVNMLIQDVYQSIKKADKDVVFGISPQGNYENCISEGADVDTWLKEEGFVDYVMPQIYWTNHYGENGKTRMYTDRIKQFSKLKRRKSVMLYAGLGLYQAGEELETDQGWAVSSSNISSQVQILFVNGFKGYSVFTYSSLLKDAGQKEMDELLKNHPFE